MVTNFLIFWAKGRFSLSRSHFMVPLLISQSELIIVCIIVRERRLLQFSHFYVSVKWLFLCCCFCSLCSIHEYRLRTWLGHQEDTNRLVIYQADSDLSAWTARCIRQVGSQSSFSGMGCDFNYYVFVLDRLTVFCWLVWLKKCHRSPWQL